MQKQKPVAGLQPHPQQLNDRAMLPSVPLTLVLAYAGFIGLGLINSRLNVTWPAIRTTFGMPVDALSVLLFGNMAGSIFASAISGRLSARVNIGVLLALSCGITAAGMLGTGAAPFWIMLVLLSVLIGLGTGAIDASLNAYAATHFSPRAMNWLHACFGIGSTLGPAIMTAAIAGRFGWQAGFLIVGAIQLALAACFVVTRPHWQGASAAATTLHARNTPLMATLGLPAAWLGILIFFAYASAALGAGQWLYSLLTEARGVPATVAGAWVSLFWASLTVGRILFGFVVQRVSPRTLLRWCMIGAILSTLLLWLNIAPWLNLGSIALLGLTLAPQYPLLTSATPGYLGRQHTANGVGLQGAAATLGGVLVTSLIGFLVQAHGPEVLGPSLVIIVTIMAGLFELLARHMRAEA